MNITDKILKSAKYVVDNSKNVAINMQKIEEYCSNFKIEKAEHWLKTAPFDMDKLSVNQKVDFLLVMHSIGYSYWGSPKWTVEYNGNLFDGSYGMVAALARAIEKDYPILNYKYLANISVSELDDVLKGNVQIPMFEERLSAIREIGKVVAEKFDRDFMNAIINVETDIDLLNIIIDNFPSYSDKSRYKDNDVFFYKRAQLLSADIFQVMQGQRFGIHNLNNLTACADYKIPQVLRHFGILEYHSDLKYMVDNKIELKKDCDEEVEIRANMIWAIELMKGIIKNKFKYVNSIIIDDQLWILSQINKCDKPYHLIRTTAY